MYQLDRDFITADLLEFFNGQRTSVEEDIQGGFTVFF